MEEEGRVRGRISRKVRHEEGEGGMEGRKG